MTLLFISSQIKIKISDLSQDQLDEIIYGCTVKNKSYEDNLAIQGYNRADEVAEYEVYDIVGKYIYIPRGFLYTLMDILPSVEIEWDTILHEKIDLTYKEYMEHRDYQLEAVETMFEYTEGILSAPTASGKTNIMIQLMQKLSLPTLILVHRNHLLKQWRERIKKYLGYEPGIIGEGKFKVKNITIAMIPTLHANPDRIEKIKDRFSVLMIDECHHVPAYTWLSNICRIRAHHIYGCTATTVRKDQLQKLMFLAIGPVRHVMSEGTSNGAVIDPTIIAVRTSFVGFPTFTRKDFTKLMPALVIDDNRNKLITTMIAMEPERYHLVLSDRIAHLDYLKMLLDKIGIKSEMVIGSVPIKDRQEIFERVANGKIHVLFATSLADEGLDIPILDRLHLTFPTSNPNRNMQQIGRIRRPHPNKKDAIVYDYWDWQQNTLSKQFNNRRAKYRSNRWKIK